jgi:patatin-like phospholipase/acyl hydrolase
MVWEAARATCAAPAFFKRISIGVSPLAEEFIDGGLGCNNPTLVLLQEAKLAFPGRHIACIISIGSGAVQTIAIPKPSLFQKMLPTDVISAMKKIAADCQQVSENAARRFSGAEGV